MDEAKRQPVFGALCEIVEEEGQSAVVSSARRDVNLCRCPSSPWKRTPGQCLRTTGPRSEDVILIVSVRLPRGH